MDQDPLFLRRCLLRDTLGAFEDIATILASKTEVSAAASQFLAGYKCLARASPKARQDIFEDPRTGIWIESVESALLTYDDSFPDESCLAAWATDISLLALSAALIDEHPYRVLLPQLSSGAVFLPGARRLFHSPVHQNSVLLSLTSDGVLCVNGENIALHPVLESRGFQLIPADRLLEPPPESGIVPLKDSEITDEMWKEQLDGASKLIALHDPSMVLSRCYGSVIVPVRSEAENTHCSVSFSTRPCVLYMSWASRPELIAEAIVHESDHQLFYAYTRRAVLWDEPLESQACIYRSPWRDDPRPLDGLLRGASAFIRVGEFAGALLDMLELRTREYDWAGQRAVLTIRQSIDAVSVIRHHGVSLSQTGRDVVESLDNRARRMLDMIALWPGFETWRNSAIQKELEHDIAWRERHQNSHQDQINLR